MISVSRLDVRTALLTLFNFALDFQSNPEEISKVRSQFIGALDDAEVLVVSIKELKLQHPNDVNTKNESDIATEMATILTQSFDRFALTLPMISSSIPEIVEYVEALAYVEDVEDVEIVEIVEDAEIVERAGPTIRAKKVK